MPTGAGPPRRRAGDFCCTALHTTSHADDEGRPPRRPTAAELLVPLLRGYGPTRFCRPRDDRGIRAKSSPWPRPASVHGRLGIARAAHDGYEWGGRGLACGGHSGPEGACLEADQRLYKNIQNIRVGRACVRATSIPFVPILFHTDRGRARAEQEPSRRSAVCCEAVVAAKWRCSTTATFEKSLPSRSTIPDLVRVVISPIRT